jgi:hypothetical protein
MNPDTPPPLASGLTGLEKSGVLMSRMLHELTNSLSVLAGHMQIIEPGKTDPETLASSLSSIKWASDTMGEIVERYASFRRQVQNEPRLCSVRDLAAEIERIAPDAVPANFPGAWKWQVIAPADSMGSLQLEPRWIGYAVWEVARASRACEGQIQIFKPGTPPDARGLKPSAPATAVHRLHLLVRWRTERPAITVQDLHKPPSMNLASVIGIVRWVLGQVNYAFLPPDENRFWITLPLVNDPLSDTSPPVRAGRTT